MTVDNLPVVIPTRHISIRQEVVIVRAGRRNPAVDRGDLSGVQLVMRVRGRVHEGRRFGLVGAQRTLVPTGEVEVGVHGAAGAVRSRRHRRGGQVRSVGVQALILNDIAVNGHGSTAANRIPIGGHRPRNPTGRAIQDGGRL